MEKQFVSFKALLRRLAIVFAFILSILGYSPMVYAYDEVQEKDLSTVYSTHDTTGSAATLAKKDFSNGFKGVGRGFKNGFKATGRGFKKAGTTVGHGFKKAGTSMGKGFKWIGRKIKGVFVRNKNQNNLMNEEYRAGGTLEDDLEFDGESATPQGHNDWV